MRRSGQHAIINWLCEQNKPSLHYNDCDFKTDEPGMRGKRLSYIMYTKKERQARFLIKPRIRIKFKLLIKNYEDKPLADMENIIVIIRDPRNWVASRCSGHPVLPGRTPRLLRALDIRKPLWKEHAKSDHYKKILR